MADMMEEHPVFVSGVTREFLDGKPLTRYKCKLCGFTKGMEYRYEAFEICPTCIEYIADAHCYARRGYPAFPKQLTHEKHKVSVGLRLKVYLRDRFRCCFCGTDNDLSVDHIYPQCKGGASTLENLQTLCRPCNSKKGREVVV